MFVFMSEENYDTWLSAYTWELISTNLALKDPRSSFLDIFRHSIWKQKNFFDVHSSMHR